MRMTLTLAIALGTTGFAAAQAPPPPPARYGVDSKLDAFPQATPSDAVASAVRAIETGRLAYLAAHLMDPTFVDARVAERVAVVLPQAERELRELRDAQRRDPVGVATRDRLPDDPPAFAAAVQPRATQLAFDLLLRDVRDTLADNPSHLKDLRRLARVPEIPTNGDTAEVAIPGVEGRAVHFRLVGGRWYVEDRQNPAPAN